ncbi:major facilitator superfamily domain-containing protein [Pisolithus marmoratus]|nr:major facilitator superfamily domain-containing protein [Pisolithus marmoratus]
MSSSLQSGPDGEVKGAGPRELDHAAEPENGAERQLRHELDLRLVPVIVILAMMSSIDRIGVTFARLKGFQSDLHLTDVQYDTVLAVTYASYCLALVPSNMFIHRTTRPSTYIGCCVVLWGIISTLTGLTKDYISIIMCRVLLSIPEAAFYAGSSYLLSSWYTCKELGLRTAILIAGGSIAVAFGSVSCHCNSSIHSYSDAMSYGLLWF